MKNFIKEVCAWVIVVVGILVLCAGCACIYKLSTGSEFIDTDYITAKEGQATSNFAGDQIRADMKIQCSKGDELWRGLHITDVSIGKTYNVFCGSYEEIQKRFHTRYLGIFKDVISQASCKNSNNTDIRDSILKVVDKVRKQNEVGNE